VFSAAPEAIRRPVDLLGLLELADHQGMTETDQVAVVEAIRPDGTRRRFAFGGVTVLTGPDAERDTDAEQDTKLDTKLDTERRTKDDTDE